MQHKDWRPQINIILQGNFIYPSVINCATLEQDTGKNI